MTILFQSIGVGDADDGTISVEEVPRHISANATGKTTRKMLPLTLASTLDYTSKRLFALEIRNVIDRFPMIS